MFALSRKPAVCGVPGAGPPSVKGSGISVMRIQRDWQESGAGTWATPAPLLHTHTGVALGLFFSIKTGSGDPLGAAHSPGWPTTENPRTSERLEALPS